MTFVIQPNWPTIVELAKELWDEPNKEHSGRDDIRFGSRGSKSVQPSTNRWFDHEANYGGGYLELHIKVKGEPPPFPVNGNGKLPAWEDIAAIYDYRGTDGRLVLQAIRTITGAPRFRQRTPDASAKHGWNWQGVKDIPVADRPLYRLPELLAAPSGSMVFIPEGEKDVDNVITKLKLLATCNLHGAAEHKDPSKPYRGKWHPAWSRYLGGHDAVILADNDKTGEDHALDVAKKLHGIARTVRVLRLPGLGPKGDVSDWIAAGGTREELLRLAAEAPEIAPSIGPNPDPQPDADEPPPLWEANHPANDETLPEDAPITEQSIMRAFVVLYRDRLRFNHDSNAWFVWSGQLWQVDRRKLAFAWALDLCRTRSLSATVQKVRFSSAVEQGARAMPPLSTAQEDWDADHWLLGTPGGVVELRTGILRPGRPEDMITRTTAVAPADTPDCPRWLGFLDYAFNGNEQNVFFLQRYFGYCLTGLVAEEFFVFLFGDAGTGKGTATETVRGILGTYADVVPVEVFISQSWRPAEYYRALLPGKRLILAAEPARDTVWNEAFVNEMTGGDRLSGRHPAGRPFDFTPTHKPLLHGNYMPKVHGQAGGLKRRLGILPFNRPPAKPDRGLKAALRKEWPAILRWMIEGCLAWQNRGLDPPADVIAANAKYFGEQDTFGRWVEDRCIIDHTLHLGPAKLRSDFNAWAREVGEDVMTATQINEAVERFRGAKLRRVTIHGNQLVQGIGLKPVPSWQDNYDR